MDSELIIGIVDDDSRMLESVEDLLASAGYESRLFNSAESFLAADVIACLAGLISDVGLPGMNGCELVTRVRAQAPDLPIIMITGRETADLREECLCAGALALFAKPFDSEVVLGALRKAIADSQA